MVGHSSEPAMGAASLPVLWTVGGIWCCSGRWPHCLCARDQCLSHIVQHTFDSSPSTVSLASESFQQILHLASFTFCAQLLTFASYVSNSSCSHLCALPLSDNASILCTDAHWAASLRVTQMIYIAQIQATGAPNVTSDASHGGPMFHFVNCISHIFCKRKVYLKTVVG